MVYVIYALLVALTCFGTLLVSRNMNKRGFRVKSGINITVMLTVEVLLCFLGGATLWTVKGIVLSLILLYASVQDISTHEADDFLWIMLLILALVGIEKEVIVSMIFGGLIAFLPMMLVVMFTREGGIGGADIKISTAAALSLGFFGSGIGLMFGLTFAVIYRLVFCKVKNRTVKEPFAMLPFLSTGLLIGYKRKQRCRDLYE